MKSKYVQLIRVCSVIWLPRTGGTTADNVRVGIEISTISRRRRRRRRSKKERIQLYADVDVGLPTSKRQFGMAFPNPSDIEKLSGRTETYFT